MVNITISKAISIGNNKLKKITDNYINETYWILGQCLKKNTHYLLINKNNLINSHEFDLFNHLINRRTKNEPLQLILISLCVNASNATSLFGRQTHLRVKG